MTAAPQTGAGVGDARLVQALRAGEETAFRELVRRYHGSMVRLATVFVGNRSVAEEVAQEAWLGLLNGLDRFEGRSSLKTWLFRILTNTAKTRGEREGRTIPFSAFAEVSGETGEPAVEADRFLDASHARYPGHWAAPPRRWDTIPEERLLATETRAHLDAAIGALPASQREVITLRDIEGWSSDEVCSVLSISETNQRVLLHRARSKVRSALERYLDETEGNE